MESASLLSLLFVVTLLTESSCGRICAMLPPGYEWFQCPDPPVRWKLLYHRHVCAEVLDIGGSARVMLRCGGGASRPRQYGAAPTVGLGRKHVEWWAAWRERTQWRRRTRASAHRIDGSDIIWDGESERLNAEQIVMLLQYCVQAQKDTLSRSNVRNKAPTGPLPWCDERAAVSELMTATFGSRANFQRLLAAATAADARLSTLATCKPLTDRGDRPRDGSSFQASTPIPQRVLQHKIVSPIGWAQAWGGCYSVGSAAGAHRCAADTQGRRREAGRRDPKGTRRLDGWVSRLIARFIKLYQATAPGIDHP